MSYFYDFGSFTRTAIVNPNPVLLQPRIAPPEEGLLQVQRCLEFQDSYQVEITVRGVSFNNVQGNLIYFISIFLLFGLSIFMLVEIVVTTNREHPALSAHEITLSLPNAEPLAFRVPWPFLVDGIELSIKKKKKTELHIALKKSLLDAWPVEFGGRSKWDPDRLTRWKDLANNGDLKVHTFIIYQTLYLNLFFLLTDARRGPV